MYLAGKRARLLAVVLVAAACTEEPATAPTEASWAEDLDLLLPALSPEQLVARSTFTSDPPAGPLANSEPPPPDADYWENYEWPDVVSDIWNAKTRANFLPGRLTVIGSHEYGGNVASISTTGTVSYQGQTIGTQTAFAQQSIAFLAGFLSNFIWVEARVYVDKECGLNGWGNSRHEAGWQAVMGGPVSEFTRTARSSTSEREYQPECPPEPVTFAGGSDDYSGDRVMCYFWVEYDLYTGEILDAWLMYCTGGG
jgi:hypothetical protein